MKRSLLFSAMSALVVVLTLALSGTPSSSTTSLAVADGTYMGKVVDKDNVEYAIITLVVDSAALSATTMGYDDTWYTKYPERFTGVKVLVDGFDQTVNGLQLQGKFKVGGAEGKLSRKNDQPYTFTCQYLAANSAAGIYLANLRPTTKQANPKVFPSGIAAVVDPKGAFLATFTINGKVQTIKSGKFEMEKGTADFSKQIYHLFSRDEKYKVYLPAKVEAGIGQVK